MPPPPPPIEPVILTGIGTDAVNSFEDLSGLPASTAASGASTPLNPYDTLLSACSHSPAAIARAYSTHRTARNAAQAARLTSSDFTGLTPDPILSALTADTPDPAADPRNCLVFWARPPSPILDLIATVQQRLLAAAPAAAKLWCMPRANLHLTVLELTHSTTAAFVESLVERIGAAAARAMVEWVRDPAHRARLVRPMVSFDAAAIALSFLPADDSEYSYHHLRRDFYRMSKEAGVGVTSRYVVPSAHITVARFVGAPAGAGGEGMTEWTDAIAGINRDLEAWSGSWTIGEERGVDFRKGKLWYGDGETVVQGEPF
ncbi:RNA ligase/cyclic nucleotide phosphodiesterase [Geopyxis carbonaria]|nr:RNA ligase/cyclic nucleotide phosphodiesterase [Geopyxis carbonaria]